MQKQPNSGSQSAERRYTGPLNSKGNPRGHTIRGGKAYPRNKPCPCGSGFKFKQCYLMLDTCGLRVYEQQQSKEGVSKA